MGEGFIVRKGGGGAVTEQALAPTITEVSINGEIGEIKFTITNNDSETAVILYETNDTLPDENSIELAGGATSDTLTITGLIISPAILYASANVVGKVKSNITEKSFTFIEPTYTAATGGDILEYDLDGKRYRSHTFTSNGTFEVTTAGDGDRNKVDYLIIAGGGGGGYPLSGPGGGGGAGGYRTTLGTSGGNSLEESKVTVTATPYSVTIGAGGNLASNSTPTNGNNSSVSFPSSIISIGGGGGGPSGVFRAISLYSGGSGGGGGRRSSEAAFLGGLGTAGQGTDGGNGNSGSTASSASGGGGGAGQVGSNASSSYPGNGGDGLGNVLRTGSTENRAGGGGGGSARSTPRPPGTGGLGGGGSSNVNAEVNTGSGGGVYSNGGSGLVVIRYEILPTV
jgi:hypothetical protein